MSFSQWEWFYFQKSRFSTIPILNSEMFSTSTHSLGKCVLIIVHLLFLKWMRQKPYRILKHNTVIPCPTSSKTVIYCKLRMQILYFLSELLIYPALKWRKRDWKRMCQSLWKFFQNLYYTILTFNASTVIKINVFKVIPYYQRFASSEKRFRAQPIHIYIYIYLWASTDKNMHRIRICIVLAKYSTLNWKLM